MQKNRYENVPVPVVERVKLLYAVGYRKTEICNIINQELGDIMVYTFDIRKLEILVSSNLKEFEEYKKDMAKKCREDIQLQLANLFEKASRSENKIIDTYSDKIREALDELKLIDLSERDEKGRVVNAAQALVLMEVVERLQKLSAKLAGTDAMREVEIFRQRSEIEKQAKAINVSGSLIPMPQSQNKTNFLEV